MGERTASARHLRARSAASQRAPGEPFTKRWKGYTSVGWNRWRSLLERFPSFTGRRSSPGNASPRPSGGRGSEEGATSLEAAPAAAAKATAGKSAAREARSAGAAWAGSHHRADARRHLVEVMDKT